MKWEEVKLGEHVDLVSGPAFKSTEFTSNPNDVPLIKGENIGVGCILWEKSKYYPDDGAKYFENYLLEPNDIVLAMDRPWIEAGLKFGWIRENDPKALLVQRVARLRSKNGLSQTFLRYIISSSNFASYLKNVQGGVGVPHVSGGQIKAFSFPFPPLPIQQKIASILSAYDDGIENNLKRIKLLEEAAQHLYREWFVRFRFPATADKPGWEEVNVVDGLPEGWEQLPFSAVAEYVNGFAFKPRHHSKDGLPIIKIRELKAGIGSDTPRYQGSEVPEKYKFGDNSILFSWSADLDVYWWASGEALLNQHLFLVHPLKGTNKFHFYYALKNSMEDFRNRTTGATMKHIKRTELDAVFYTNPIKEVCEQFARIAEPILNQVLNLTKQNQRLKAGRDLLLPRLMSGVLEV
jgi:type I restriction enzyme, S subunit